MKKMNRIWLVLTLALIVILGVVIYQTIIKGIITPPLDWMVKVKGGAFMMGDDEGAFDNEKPAHQVLLSTFYLSRYEVTQKQWSEVMGTDPSHFKGDDLPVESISWYNAVEFCNRLSEQEGLTPCYNCSGDAITCDFTANGYRLPTDGEIVRIILVVKVFILLLPLIIQILLTWCN